MVQEDWIETNKIVHEQAKKGEECDVLFEISSGTFATLVQIRFQFDSVLEKFVPKFWYNTKLISQLNLTIPNNNGENNE